MLPGFNPLNLAGQVVEVLGGGGPDPDPQAAPLPQGQPEHIMQFFAYSHLPGQLQRISAPFGQLAEAIVEHLPRNPERTVALRKLLEAKDAAVRAALAR